MHRARISDIDQRPGRVQSRVTSVTALAAVAIVVAACGAPAATAGPTVAPATPGPATPVPATDPPMSAPPATAGPTVAAAEVTLGVATAAGLGEYVTGADGLALYIFTPDAGAPGTSACNGDCASAWPPLTVSAAGGAAAGAGVSGELGTVTRADGTLQVTLGGWPLYYFAADTAAGDVKGQGVGDVWYLAAPDGQGIGAPTANAVPAY